MPTFDPVIINEKLNKTFVFEYEDGTEAIGVVVGSEKVFTFERERSLLPIRA